MKKFSKQWYKLLSLLLVAIMMISAMPMGVFAVANSDGYIEVSTVEDLYNIRMDLTANYILMNDIDLTEVTAEGGEWDFDGRGWNPIGSNDVYADMAFSGTFDGNGYYIIGMRINATTLPSGASKKYTYAGLFANVTGEVRNLHMKDVNVTAGRIYTGAIAAYNSGVITNCSVAGTVISEFYYYYTYPSGMASEYYNYVGGIVGCNAGTVSKCYNTSDVTGYKYSGGIAGYNENAIDNCYNTGSINGNYAGGIAGRNGGSITNCYNIGNVGGRAAAIADNGSNKITNSYYLSGTGNGTTGATSLTEAQMRLQSMYPGFDFEDTWVINSYANYPYPQLKSNIQDLSETVELIRVIAYPAKTEYLTGDELNTAGGMFEAVYISGKTDLISITADMITGYNPATVGTQTLTVNYGGQTDTFDITVSKRPDVTGVTVLTEPSQKEFIVGTELDFSGATVKVYYDNDTSETLDVTVDMTTGANINHLGNQTVTVTMGDYSDSFEIKVIPATIQSIVLSALPDKLVYIEGEKLDLNGMIVTAIYDNGREVAVASDYTVSGFVSAPGTYTVTLDFAGKTTTFDVTVNAKKVNSIQITAKPNKIDYIVGEDLDLTGLVVIAAFETGEVAIIEDYEVSSLDGTAGTKVITVTYRGCSASFTVNVEIIAVESLAITQMPVKLNYIENEPLNTEGLIVKATYNNGDVRTVSADEYDIVGFSSLPGTHTLHIAFGGKVVTYSITVSPKVLSDVRITLPAKTTYHIGEEFDATGMEVIACYNNGQEFTVDSYTMTGFDSLTAGAKEIVINYGGLTRSFSVAVAEQSAVDTNGAIKIGTLKGRLGETVAVPVTITKNPGLSAFCHTVTFDAENFKFVSVTANNGFANGTVIVNDEKSTNGEVTVLWFGNADVTGDGVAYTVNLEILETATDGVYPISIAFDDNDNGNASGENIIFEAVNGSLEVLSYWLGDLNGDRVYTMADLLQLAHYVSGKQMTMTDQQLKSADVNEDGVIDIHDITLLNQWLLVAEI